MWLPRKPSHQLLCLCSTLLFLYVVSYLCLTLRGAWYFTQSGELRYKWGFAVSDLAEWRPQGLWWQANYKFFDGTEGSRGNTLGYLYSPLIALDRTVWHKTKRILSEDDFKTDGKVVPANGSDPLSSETNLRSSAATPHH